MGSDYNSKFWQENEEYHGVIAVEGDKRFSVSPNGKRWLVQKRVVTPEGPKWVVSHRTAYLSRILQSVPPEVLRKLPQGLPERPSDQPRPWAETVQEQRDRVRRANHKADQYQAVIVTGENARLIFSDCEMGPRYFLQVRNGQVWKTVARSKTKDVISDHVWTRKTADHRCAPAVGDPALKFALHQLPQNAADYRAPSVESIADATAAIQPPSAERRKPPTRAGAALQSRQAARGRATAQTLVKPPQRRTQPRAAAKASPKDAQRKA